MVRGGNDNSPERFGLSKTQFGTHFIMGAAIDHSSTKFKILTAKRTEKEKTNKQHPPGLWLIQLATARVVVHWLLSWLSPFLFVYWHPPENEPKVPKQIHKTLSILVQKTFLGCLFGQNDLRTLSCVTGPKSAWVRTRGCKWMTRDLGAKGFNNSVKTNLC